MPKTPAELLTLEFLERMLEDLPRALARGTGEGSLYTYNDDYRRLMREKLLERLATA